MPPLYPKMRERPEEFRINPAWPYYGNIAFACFPSTVFGLRQNDRSPYGKAATPASGVTSSNVWLDSQLRRFTILSNNNTQYWSYGVGRLQISDTMTVLSYARVLATPNLYTRLVSKHGTTYGFTCALVSHYSVPTPFFGFSTTGTDWNYAFAGTDATPVALSWYHLGFVRNQNLIGMYLNGRWYVGGDFPKTNAPTNPLYQVSQDIRVCSDAVVGGSEFQAAEYSDIVILNCVLSSSEHEQIADPSNLDLRIGGIPLILHPRRRYWPVVSEQAVPKMVPWHLFQQVGA